MSRIAARGQNLTARADKTTRAADHSPKLWRILRHFSLTRRIFSRSSNHQSVGCSEIHYNLNDPVQNMTAIPDLDIDSDHHATNDAGGTVISCKRCLKGHYIPMRTSFCASIHMCDGGKVLHD